MPGVRRSSERAVTVINRALDLFAENSGLQPRVVLIPPRLFDQFLRERRLIDSVLPDLEPVDGREWTDVRVVEHGEIEEIEVY